jgi:signal transduction histidine kinase
MKSGERLRSTEPSRRRADHRTSTPADVWKEALLIVLLTVAYFTVGKLGLVFPLMRPSITPVWPPSGIAVAALLIFGYRLWPGVFLGALAVELTTACGFLTSLFVAGGNTVESLVAVWLANRFAGGQNFFKRPWDVVKFTVLVGMASPLISPPLGVRGISLSRFIPWASDPSIGLIWWLSDAVSLLVLTPLLVVWAVTPWRRWSLRQTLEFGLLLLLVMVLGEAVFGGAAPATAKGYLFSYLCLPLLFWVAFRFSEREMMTATFVLGIVVMWDTLHGYGMFTQVSPDQPLLVYHGFLVTASVMSLSLAAVVGQRRRASQELRTANQMLRMLSDCNQALVHIRNEGELIEKICRIISEVGGYRLAWVGFAELGDGQVVRPVAAVGSGQHYLSGIKVSWADDELGQGPTGTAISTGTVCKGMDFLSDPKLRPWRSLALEHGFRSSVALPLLAQGRTFGTLTIYAGEPDAFDEKQIGLLTELAGDMAFGITAARARAEQEQVSKQLEQKTAQLQALSIELVQAEQRERRRVAQILHDCLQQLLVGARYNLEFLRSQSEDKDSQETLLRVDGLLAQCIQTSRSLTAELSPPILYEAGLASALGWLGRWFQETHGLTVQITATEELISEPEDTRVTIFQAVRELLFNVIKHAKVKEAQVRVTMPEEHHLRVSVYDEGAGFEPARVLTGATRTEGLGLFSLRERLESFGGEFAIQSAPGMGTRCTMSFPLRRTQPCR